MSYSRRQLYAMGETFGDSATRMEVGGRIIYGGGGGKSAPAPQPTTRITESGPTVTNRTTANEIPNYLTDASQDLIARGRALTSRPYEAYTGARVAEFSPDMQTAFDRMRNQQIAPQIGEATGLASLAGQRAMDYGQFQQGVQQYMNPYMQNVVDIERRKAQEASDQQSAMLSGQAARQNAFGGSGAALQQRALRRDTAQQLSDIQAQGLDRAYQSAVGQYNQGIAGGLQAAGALGGLGQQQFGQEMDVTKGLGASGDVQRQREQALLDVGYGDYLTAQKYPYEQLAFQQGLVSGVPYSTTQRTSEISQPGKQVSQMVEPPKEQPNPASQLIGAGVAAYGACGISSLNQPQLAAMADDMSDQQLIALQQDPTQGPVTLGVVAEALLNRDKIRAAGIGQLAATNPPPERTVVAEALGGGISDLGAPNLENMDEVTAAGGGIIAFEDGGSTSPFGRFIDRTKEAFEESNEANKLRNKLQMQYGPASALPGLFYKQSDAERAEAKRIVELLPKLSLTELKALEARGAAKPTATPAVTSAATPTRTSVTEADPSKFLGIGSAANRTALNASNRAADAKAVELAAAKDTPTVEKPAPTGAGAANAGLSALKTQTAAGIGDLKKQVEDINAARTAAANSAVERAKAQETELGEYGVEESKRLKEREKALEGAEDKNFNMALIEAGLAMMSGTSANAFENIGKGALVGTAAYTRGIERIQNRKEKLDEAVIALENAKRSDKRVSQERMDRLEANVANAATANAEALYNFGSKALDMSREDARFATQIAVQKAQIAAANRTPSEIQMVERIMAEKKIPFSEALAFVTGAKRAPVDTEKLRGEWLDMTKRMQINRDYPNVKTFEDYVTVMGSGGGSGGASGGYKVLGVR